jgi:hypothetical protein
MRILLATDGSEYSEAAVEKLARHPFPADSEVLVLSVFEPPPFPFTVPGAGVNFDAQIQETAGKAVEKPHPSNQRDDEQLISIGKSSSSETCSASFVSCEERKTVETVQRTIRGFTTRLKPRCY